ncbi:MAG: hypothetical protein ACE5F7_09265, partial [Nitrospiria bacterium]
GFLKHFFWAFMTCVILLLGTLFSVFSVMMFTSNIVPSIIGLLGGVTACFLGVKFFLFSPFEVFFMKIE